MKEAFLSAASGLTFMRTEVALSEEPGRHKAICSGDAALLEAMRKRLSLSTRTSTLGDRKHVLESLPAIDIPNSRLLKDFQSLFLIRDPTNVLRCYDNDNMITSIRTRGETLEFDDR